MQTRKSMLTVTRPDLLDRGSDRRFRQLLHDLFAFAAGLGEARDRFARHIGLTPTQYMVLIVIQSADPKAELGISQIAAGLRLSGAFITIEVGRLVEEGLIEKRPHTSDRRRVRLAVTKLGVERLERLAALQRPVNDALFRSLGRTDFEQLAILMARLCDDSERAISLADHLATQR